MISTAAPIQVPFLTSYGYPLKIQGVGTIRSCAKLSHELLPLLAVRAHSPRAVQDKHNVVCYLMGHRISKTIGKVFGEYIWIVTDLWNLVFYAKHTGCHPAQVE